VDVTGAWTGAATDVAGGVHPMALVVTQQGTSVTGAGSFDTKVISVTGSVSANIWSGTLADGANQLASYHLTVQGNAATGSGIAASDGSTAAISLTRDASGTGGAGGGAGTAGHGGAGTGGGTGSMAAAILKLCSFTNACSFGPVVTAPIGTCVENVASYLTQKASPFSAVAPAKAQVFERLLACASTAHTCLEFTSCGSLSYGCAAPLTPCHGNVAVQCKTVGDNVPIVTDCAALGFVCDKGACVPAAPGAACAFSSSPPTTCSGNKLVSCVYDSTNTGAEDARDCGTSATCTALGASSAYCIPNDSPTCTTAGRSCDGDALVLCASIGGKMLQGRSDCAVAGRKCGAKDASSQLDCQPAVGTECATTTASACAGNDISSCVNGATVKITCADYGLTTCGVATTFPICM
jgi:hypothetical protein